MAYIADNRLQTRYVIDSSFDVMIDPFLASILLPARRVLCLETSSISWGRWRGRRKCQCGSRSIPCSSTPNPLSVPIAQ